MRRGLCRATLPRALEHLEHTAEDGRRLRHHEAQHAHQERVAHGHTDEPEHGHGRPLAQARTRAYEPALQSLIDAVGIDPRTGFGEPYRAAGDVLMKLERYADAEDAFEHYVETNSSAIDGWYKLARARSKQGKEDTAKQALTELRDTWRTLPSYLRRKQWTWRLRSLFVG